jgi:predicted RecB family nuclease
VNGLPGGLKDCGIHLSYLYYSLIFGICSALGGKKFAAMKNHSPLISRDIRLCASLDGREEIDNQRKSPWNKPVNLRSKKWRWHMIITDLLFEACLKCPTKCWLRSTGETGTENAYSDWVRAQTESYCAQGTRRLRDGVAPHECALSLSEPLRLKIAKWMLAVNVTARVKTLESRLHAVERVPSQGRGKPSRFIPIRFAFRNKLTKDDKLLMAFDAFVLSETLGREISHGKIIHGEGHAAMKMKTSVLAGQVRKVTAQIATLVAHKSPPDLVLNRHCVECEFQRSCRQKALEKDDLSLLAGMSEKERKKLHSKGIFTVTQLSYTFRPRRRPKRQRDKREKYHHSLKALAIREKKIHIVGRPELKIEGTPVYLDVEGLPDRDFYYLIGLRIGNAESAAQHSLWADTVADEGKIWREFLGILETVEKPVLIHYGSLEKAFFRLMMQRYGGLEGESPVSNTIRCSINLVSLTFAQVYFPTYSNGLKDVARFLGFEWSEPNAAGIQTIVWRKEWERSRDPRLKQKLTTYNAEDCQALGHVTEWLGELLLRQSGKADSRADDVVNIDSLPRWSPFKFQRNRFRLPEFEEINRAAYWDYQRDRILLKASGRLRRIAEVRAKKKKAKPRISKTVFWPPPQFCPRCGSAKFYRHQASKKVLVDLRIGQSGLKRWITSFRFFYYRCPSCLASFHNHDRAWTAEKFGHNLQAFFVYLNIDLRVLQAKVTSFLNDMFGLNLSRGSTNRFKRNLAAFYGPTYDGLVQKILRGPLVHADETSVRLLGKVGYVWAFTTLEEAVYMYTPSREGEMVLNLLKDFKGVLVSDFYAAYDSLGCPQQKCLIHLIRDMNDDLLKEPFNEEMKSLVAEFASLVKPMIETVDRFGLKARFLRKHKVEVRRFFKRLSRRNYQTETATKCKARLEKNRWGLFTFLDYDGVPWNNNNAEHAVKAFALLRRDLAGVSTEAGIRDYLVLLSVCETCRFKGVSFLEFLRSRNRDLDEFAESRGSGRGREARQGQDQGGLTFKES